MDKTEPEDVGELDEIPLTRESSLDLPKSDDENEESEIANQESENGSDLPPPEDQKMMVKVAMKTDDLVLGETRYIIPARWFTSWKGYAHFDDLKIYSRRATSPPPSIPNLSLCQQTTSSNDTPSLKVGLLDVFDYVTVNEEVWGLLEGWYGSDATFPRKTIKQSSHSTKLMVEVRTPYLFFYSFFLTGILFCC